jgi:hypothetical protein
MSKADVRGIVPLDPPSSLRPSPHFPVKALSRWCILRPASIKSSAWTGVPKPSAITGTSTGSLTKEVIQVQTPIISARSVRSSSQRTGRALPSVTL